MSQAAYRTLLKIAGTPTTLTDEATTKGTGNTYQITSEAKRVLDRNTEIVVKQQMLGQTRNVGSSRYTVDYLSGTITLNFSQSSAIMVSGKYIPLANIAGVNQYSLDISGDILEDTNFNDAGTNGGFKTKLYGIRDISASISRFDDLNKTFKTKLKDRDLVLLEIKPNNSTEIIKGWFVIESANTSGEVNSLESEEISLQLDGNFPSSFSWRD